MREYCAQSRLEHSQALKRALDLHLDVHELSDEEESELLPIFFIEPSGGSRVVAPPIRLGTDCSGLDTPVFALKS